MDSQLPAEILNIIPKLDEQQLRSLNSKIVARIKHLHKFRQLEEMSKFSKGDRVSFECSGDIKTGTITKLNQKTVSIITDDDEGWNVAPSLLSRVIEQNLSTQDK